MSLNVFISYSFNDADKVALISKELAGHASISPIIIASERESLKPLAAKVADGIIKANVVVPVLTAKSMTTQWINQEIGFAQALDKQIVPIVEAGILESLKGFIHKELHLPYLFSGSTNKTSENKDFRKQFRILIGDLEPVAAEQDVAPTQPEKTEFEKTLEEPDKVRGHEAFVRQKQDFIRSPQGFPAAEKEFKRLTEIAEPDLELIRQKDVGLSHEVVDNGHTLIVRAGGFTLTIHVEKVGMYVNEQDIILFINRWKGNLNRQGYYPFEEYKPVLISKQKLIFDLDSAFRPCWLDKDTQHTSEHLVELSLTWLMKEIVSTRRASL